ncbi:hypothetical protein HanRHA438_Chr12g0547241 [Helianthus annuus]|nr:hypothetical protein HanRHA438_Chr12g0547241 [Helianthus annuus]
MDLLKDNIRHSDIGRRIRKNTQILSRILSVIFYNLMISILYFVLCDIKITICYATMSVLNTSQVEKCKPKN